MVLFVLIQCPVNFVDVDFFHCGPYIQLIVLAARVQLLREDKFSTMHFLQKFFSLPQSNADVERLFLQV